MEDIDLQHMRKVRCGGEYKLRQLGSDRPAYVSFRTTMRAGDWGWTILDLCKVVRLRTKFLNSVIPCVESENVIRMMDELITAAGDYVPKGDVIEIDTGHMYKLMTKEGRNLAQCICFVKRNSSAITHKEEYPGLQTQELLRAMIDQAMLYRWTRNQADVFRKCLWEYEARAYRRKRQEFNREAPEHALTEFPYDWEDIETMDIGADGHIPYIESEILYHANFGVCDADPIPGLDPFKMEIDPVYKRAGIKLGISKLEG